MRDSKASDGNDYGLGNNRFLLSGVDCWLATLSQALTEGMATSGLGGLTMVKWLKKIGEMKSPPKENWSVVTSCSVIGQGGSHWFGFPSRECCKKAICFIKFPWNPMMALISPWPVYLICLYLVLRRLFPASSLMIRLSACLGGAGMRVSCWIGFLSGTVSMHCGDAISVKTCSSMGPCQPTMESGITQSAGGQSLLSLSRAWNIHRLI